MKEEDRGGSGCCCGDRCSSNDPILAPYPQPYKRLRPLLLYHMHARRAVAARALPPRDVVLPCALCVAGFSLGVHSQTPEAFADGTSMGVMASLLTAAYTLLLARAGV